MKIKLLLALFIAGTSMILLTGSSLGRAASANQGNTGAPGDNSRTCINCHNTSSTRVALDLAVLDLSGNEVTEYKPGASYTVRVRIDSVSGPAAKAWGFQMVCLDAPLGMNGGDIKNWIDTSSNNYKISNALGRQYVEQNRPSGSNEFLVAWQAPLTSSGQLSFYAAGNGVNLNGGPTGDGAAVNSLEIQEMISTSADDLSISEYDISPNPASDWVDISFVQPSDATINLFDLNGRKINTWSLYESTSIKLDLNGVSFGMYMLEVVSSDQKRGIKRLVVR
jgi:hypothetical protein